MLAPNSVQEPCQWPLNMNLSNNYLWTSATFTERNSSVPPQQKPNDSRYFTVRAIVLNWHLGLLYLSFSILLGFPLILLMSLCIYVRVWHTKLWKSKFRWGGKPCHLQLSTDWLDLSLHTQPPVLHTEWVFGHRKGFVHFCANCMPVVPHFIILYIVHTSTGRLTHTALQGWCYSCIVLEIFL